MNKITALYLRLSVDDDNRDESNSIRGQRDLLNAYVGDNPALSAGTVTEFVDDGWSGTSFQRPAVTDLLERTRRSEIGCIVVKDLSRWGRNYVEVIEYLEQIFPFLGVRFISLNDGYDSEDYKGRTAPLDVAFGTIMHDVYCKELSQKVRQSYVAKAEKGEFLCGVAPYGFEKSATEKNKLVIDEESATVVRRIFDLACEGNSTTQIASILNSEGVDTPLMYRKRKGRVLRGTHSAVGEVNLWQDKNVRTILRDERYMGMQVSGKTRKPKPGSRNTVCLPESEWIKVPGAHDGIISADIFATAQAAITRFTKTGKRKCNALFARKVGCGICGHALEYAHRKDKPFYFCGSHSIDPDSKCFTGRLAVADIKAAVLPAIKIEAAKVLDMRQKRRNTASKGMGDKDAVLLETKRLTAHTARLERQGIALYEEFADGRLDRDTYLAAKAGCAIELVRAESRLAELNAMLVIQDTGSAIPKDEAILQRVLAADDVTDEILALIERIVVYGQEHIEIRFTFGDSNTL